MPDQVGHRRGDLPLLVSSVENVRVAVAAAQQDPAAPDGVQYRADVRDNDHLVVEEEDA